MPTNGAYPQMGGLLVLGPVGLHGDLGIRLSARRPRDPPQCGATPGRPLVPNDIRQVGGLMPNPLICTRFHSLQGGLLYDSRYSSVCGILIVFHVMAVVKGGIGSLTDVGAVPRRLGWESCRVISLALLWQLPAPHCCVRLCPEVQSRFNTWDTPSVHMCSSATSCNVR